jgi:hypothetical protein
MSNVLFRRPRFDIRSKYFAQVYLLERACLQSHASFLKQAVASQVMFMRQFLTVHENTVVEGLWAPVIAKVPVVLYRPAPATSMDASGSIGGSHRNSFFRNSSGNLSSSFNGVRSTTSGANPSTPLLTDASVFVLEVHPVIGIFAQWPEIMTQTLADAARLIGPTYVHLYIFVRFLGNNLSCNRDTMELVRLDVALHKLALESLQDMELQSSSQLVWVSTQPQSCKLILILRAEIVG